MPMLINYLFKKLGIESKMVVPNNHQSLQVEYGIKVLIYKTYKASDRIRTILANIKHLQCIIITKETEFFQYTSGDLVCITSSLTSQHKTSSRKESVKHAGPVLEFKIVDTKSFSLCTLDGRLLVVLFEHKEIKASSDKN